MARKKTSKNKKKERKEKRCKKKHQLSDGIEKGSVYKRKEGEEKSEKKSIIMKKRLYNCLPVCLLDDSYICLVNNKLASPYAVHGVESSVHCLSPCSCICRIPACLPALLPSLPCLVCLPASLLTPLSVCLPACLSASVTVCHFALHMFTCV